MRYAGVAGHHLAAVVEAFWRQRHGDKRLAIAKARGVKDAAYPPDDAALAQPADGIQHGGRRGLERGGNFVKWPERQRHAFLNQVEKSIVEVGHGDYQCRQRLSRELHELRE
jgi:hypothetical protein